MNQERTDRMIFLFVEKNILQMHKTTTMKQTTRYANGEIVVFFVVVVYIYLRFLMGYKKRIRRGINNGNNNKKISDSEHCWESVFWPEFSDFSLIHFSIHFECYFNFNAIFFTISIKSRRFFLSHSLWKRLCLRVGWYQSCACLICSSFVIFSIGLITASVN